MTAVNQDIGTDPAAPRLVGTTNPIPLNLPGIAVASIASVSWSFASGPPQDPLAVEHFAKVAPAVTFADGGGGSTDFLVTISAAETITMGPGRHYHELSVTLTTDQTDVVAYGIFKLQQSAAAFA